MNPQENLATYRLFHLQLACLNADTLVQLAARARLVVTVEEGTVIGGLGSAVVDVLADRLDGRMPPLRRLGVPDVFLHDYGDQDWLMEVCGLQPHQIAETITEAVGCVTDT